MNTTKLNCKGCQSPLELYRTCLTVRLICKQCQKSYPIEAYIDEMDEHLETLLANIHCNRI